VCVCVGGVYVRRERWERVWVGVRDREKERAHVCGELQAYTVQKQHTVNSEK